MPDDMMNTLKGLLGDDAEAKIGSILSALKSDTPSDSATVTPPPPPQNIPASLPSAEALEYIGKLKSVVDDMGKANDNRSNLLKSLRPYMRNERQRSIDKAIKILNLSKFANLLK